MTSEWFIEKFQFDFEANANWADYLSEMDEHNKELVSLFSQIINVHHIWIRRITCNQIESSDWDSHEPRYFDRLNNHNFQETLDFLESVSDNRLIQYEDASGLIHEALSESLLYHILHHSAHHRGQLSLLAQQLKLDHRPALNFVGWPQKR